MADQQAPGPLPARTQADIDRDAAEEARNAPGPLGSASQATVEQWAADEKRKAAQAKRDQVEAWRDQIAASVLPSLCNGASSIHQAYQQRAKELEALTQAQWIAHHAYKIADAMVAERIRRKRRIAKATTTTTETKEPTK